MISQKKPTANHVGCGLNRRTGWGRLDFAALQRPGGRAALLDVFLRHFVDDDGMPVALAQGNGHVVLASPATQSQLFDEVNVPTHTPVSLWGRVASGKSEVPLWYRISGRSARKSAVEDKKTWPGGLVTIRKVCAVDAVYRQVSRAARNCLPVGRVFDPSATWIRTGQRPVPQ